MKLYRCMKCGKWSHAKKRPTSHRRWVREGDPDYREALNENTLYGPYLDDPGFEYQEPGHRIACGPFETWLAEKVAK